MKYFFYNKGRWLLTYLLALLVPQFPDATPLSSDIHSNEETGPVSGGIMSGNPESRNYYKKHQVGDEKKDNTVKHGSWRSDQIKGAVSLNDDEYGQLHPTVNIIIHRIKRS